MGQMTIKKARQSAAALIEAVLDEQVAPQLAINRWPEAEPDRSLEAAFQALWHLEADEDLQRREVFYLDAQLELLKQMAKYLARGEALPAYMQRNYAPEHQARFFYSRDFWRDTWSGGCSLLKDWKRLLDKAFALVVS